MKHSLIVSTREAFEGHPFRHWSPLQLAYSTGCKIRHRPHGSGVRAHYLAGPNGRERPTGCALAWYVLARLAKRQGIDPAAKPLAAVPDAEWKGPRFD